MEKKLLSIGEISRLKGITKKALRFYERIGLLKPAYVNPSNNYRYYSIEQFVAIDIIKAMRVIDISPLEIRSVFRHRDTLRLLGFLDVQKEEAARKIEDLRRINRLIEGVQRTIRESIAAAGHRGVYTRDIPPRRILTLPFNDLSSDEAAALEFSKFDRIIARHRLLNAYQTGILFAPAEAGAVPFEIFNTVEVEPDSDVSMTSTLPGGRYLCVCYDGATAAARTRKINQYCRRKGLQPALVLQVELLNDVFATGPASVELQLLLPA